MRAAASVCALLCAVAAAPAHAQSRVAEVIEKTNVERSKRGLEPLTESAILTRAAQAHADEMARLNYFDHKGKDGRTPARRAADAGYRGAAIGENIFLGPRTVAQAMAGWMRSPGHRSNLLKAVYTEVGVGYAERGERRYWVQLFGAPTAGKRPRPTGHADSDTAPSPLPPTPALPPQPERLFLDGFEQGVYLRWRLSGDCWGAAPSDGTRERRAIKGWSGAYFASSANARTGDARIGSGTGAALSPEFPITHTRLRFKLGGGDYPGQVALNLLVRDDEGVERIVRTETGNDSDRLTEAEWDLGELVGKRARLEMVDRVAFGARAYLLVDDLEMSGLPPDPGVALAPEPIRSGPIMTVEGKLPPPPTLKTASLTLPDGSVITGRRMLTLEATGYGPGENGPWGDRTALGTKVGFGTVAVDPRVIPLKTRLWVEGYGYCVALDTGGAIKGMKIDLGFDTDSEAARVGRRPVRVLLLD